MLGLMPKTHGMPDPIREVIRQQDEANEKMRLDAARRAHIQETADNLQITLYVRSDGSVVSVIVGKLMAVKAAERLRCEIIVSAMFPGCWEAGSAVEMLKAIHDGR